MGIGRIASAIISIVVAVIPLLYLLGDLSFLYPLGIPSPAQMFNVASPGSPNGPLPGAYGLIPYGGFSITALLLFSVLSRLGSAVTSAVAPRPNMANMRGMPFGLNSVLGQGMTPNQIPENLPKDITTSQLVILREYERGTTKPKDVGKKLTMDKKSVEQETQTLISNGYLTNKRKLTPKALGLIY